MKESKELLELASEVASKLPDARDIGAYSTDAYVRIVQLQLRVAETLVAAERMHAEALKMADESRALLAAIAVSRDQVLTAGRDIL